MIPDLGKYATVVLSSYGITLFLLLFITLHSVRRAKRVAKQLAIAEQKKR